MKQLYYNRGKKGLKYVMDEYTKLRRHMWEERIWYQFHNEVHSIKKIPMRHEYLDKLIITCSCEMNMSASLYINTCVRGCIQNRNVLIVKLYSHLSNKHIPVFISYLCMNFGSGRICVTQLL